MLKIFISLMFSSFLFTAPAFAGAGHEHGHGHSHEPATAEVVKTKAMKKVKFLAETKKIDPSWVAITAHGAEKKQFSKGVEWVVSFKNETLSDASKRTLYLFYSLNGHYIAANYSGK